MPAKLFNQMEIRKIKNNKMSTLKINLVVDEGINTYIMIFRKYNSFREKVNIKFNLVKTSFLLENYYTVET